MSWAQAVSEVKPELLRWAINYFGLAIVLGVSSWLLWGEYQDQVDARFASIERELSSYKDRVGFLEADALHRRTIEAEEQKQRAELFSAIEKHLDNISRAN
jgi:hypothetical protein